MTHFDLPRYYLAPQPSFLAGVASLFDFGNALSTYNYSRSGEEADARAVFADWATIGDDLRAAIDALTVEMPRL